METRPSACHCCLVERCPRLVANDRVEGKAELGVTIDQIAAKELGKDAPLLSPEISLGTRPRGRATAATAFIRTRFRADADDAAAEERTRA